MHSIIPYITDKCYQLLKINKLSREWHHIVGEQKCSLDDCYVDKFWLLLLYTYGAFSNAHRIFKGGFIIVLQM